MRRLVTGHTEGGRSHFAHDGEAPQHHELASGELILHELWRTVGPVASNAGNEEAVGHKLEILPDHRGTVFRVAEIPAGGGAHIEMHETPTTDYNVVLSGEMMVVTETQEVKVAAGDVIVVTTGRHTWRNDGPDTCVFASVMVGR